MRTRVTLVLNRTLVWRSSEGPSHDEFDYTLLRVCSGVCSGNDACYVHAEALHREGNAVEIQNIDEPTIYRDVERACKERTVLWVDGAKYKVV